VKNLNEFHFNKLKKVTSKAKEKINTSNSPISKTKEIKNSNVEELEIIRSKIKETGKQAQSKLVTFLHHKTLNNIPNLSNDIDKEDSFFFTKALPLVNIINLTLCKTLGSNNQNSLEAIIIKKKNEVK